MQQLLPEFHNASELEGWGIFDTSIQDATHNRFELQRWDEKETFASDNEASAFVVRNAAKDKNSIYADAIRYLAENSPNEIDSVIRSNDSLNPGELEDVLNFLEITL